MTKGDTPSRAPKKQGKASTNLKFTMDNMWVVTDNRPVCI